MTPEAQKIAIAEACGWQDIQNCTCAIEWRGVIPGGGDFKHIPDYLNDLDDMHEAEEILNKNQMAGSQSIWLSYIHRLREIVTKIHPKMDTKHEWLLIRATAAQRAEAFLRCLGKWT